MLKASCLHMLEHWKDHHRWTKGSSCLHRCKMMLILRNSSVDKMCSLLQQRARGSMRPDFNCFCLNCCVWNMSRWSCRNPPPPSTLQTAGVSQKKSANLSFNLYSTISVIFLPSRDIVVGVIRYPLLVIKYNINMAQFHSFHLFTQFDLWIFAVMLWLKNDRLKFNLVWIIEHYLEWFLQPILRPNNVH